jgi:hypothetical protein
MSLAFTGPAGTAEHRWIVYALLSDNVRHHLDSDSPTGLGFEEIQAIGRALGGGRVVVNARRLRAELDRATSLLPRAVSDLAISRHTRAVIERSWPPPNAQPNETTLVQGVLTIPWLSPHVRTLDEVFGNLVRSLLAITDGAGETDLLEVEES